MEALIVIGLFAWVAWLLWNGRESKADARAAHVYSQHFTAEELETLGRNLDGTKKEDA